MRLYPTPVTTPPRYQLIYVPELSRPGVAVFADPDFGEPQQCDHCALVGAVATVRIYGAPHPRHVDPIELVEVCAPCAPTVLDEALSEQDECSRNPIRIEVAQ